MQREQVLYTILKLDTKFICENNLDIQNYTLKTAANDKTLVSVGDNILFDRIRHYKGDDRSYKIIFKDICYLRQALKKAKKEGKQKEARVLNQVILKTLFVKDVINVESTTKSEFDRVAKAGFYLNGTRYVAFTAGAGQLRRETVTFINAELEKPMFDILSCGIAERVEKINIAKFSAYFALTSSSIMWVDTPKCCVIKDFETVVPKQKVDWICKDENGVGYVEERIMDVPLNSADGQGLIDPAWAQHWAENMALDYVPSEFVARSAYIKGDFVVFDFKEYARQNGIKTITDTYGTVYDIEEIDCLISESQFKMYKYYKSWEEYQTIVENNGIKWGIARYNKKVDPVWTQTNYQFIQLLDVNKEQIRQIINPTIEWIKNVCSGDKLYAMLYCLGGFNENELVEYNDVYSRGQSLATKAVIKDPRFLEDTYVQHKIYKSIVDAINRAKIGKIWIRGNYQFAVSDPIAQCRSALGLPVASPLGADCVYSNFWNNLNITGDVMIGRNPCIDKHELNPCSLYRDEETDYWYRYIKSGVIFSIYDTSVCRMEDSDFDGDIVFSTDNPLFINKQMKQNSNIIMYDKVKAPLHKINHRNLIDGYKRGFGSKVGVYSNHATCIEAIKAMFIKPEQQTQRDELERRKKLLREIVGAEIDSTKGLAKPKEPWEFTHFEKVNCDDDDITKSEKYYHNSLVIKKKPYFFRYLYPELNKKYKQYESKYNEISQCVSGIKLKKLLIKQNKTEVEKNIIRRYQKFSPLINSNCTMNILCREIENIDFDIRYGKTNRSLLPYREDMVVDPKTLMIFKEMYRKFCNKKAAAYITETFESDIDEMREIKYSITDSILEELREEWENLEINTLDTLTYIYALSQHYAKFNWTFAWDLLDDRILEVIGDGTTIAPIESENGKEYFGKKYELKKINKIEDYEDEQF